MTTLPTRSFALGDVLSITTGILVSPRHIDGIYDILGFMTGENLFTHQLPRAADQCAPAILAQHPDLAHVAKPTGITSEAQAAFWVSKQAARLGTDALDITPLGSDHVRPDPIIEARNMFGADRIIVVTPEVTAAEIAAMIAERAK